MASGAHARRRTTEAIVVACLISCGGKTSTDDTLGSGASNARAQDDSCPMSLPAYDPNDLFPRCTAARAYVEFEYPDALRTYDMISRVDQSSMRSAERGVIPKCRDLCDPEKEYAVRCRNAPPPPSCRSVDTLGSGAKSLMTSCCACGT
jgi:hypothetical protein